MKYTLAFKPRARKDLKALGSENLCKRPRRRAFATSSRRLSEFAILQSQFRLNRSRFPEDFAFQLSAEEVTNLRSQIATSGGGNWSQFATSSSKHRGKAYRPLAFTEHGALQAANILRSPRAVQMSVFVIRAFVKMRETLLSTRELAKKLARLEKQLIGRLDSHEAAIVHTLQRVMDLIDPPALQPPPPRPRIGFKP